MSSCENKLIFEDATFEKKLQTEKDGNTPKITINVPIAITKPIVLDSINDKVFESVKNLILMNENSDKIKNYYDLNAAFLDAYLKTKKEFPNDRVGWEAKVDGKTTYKSEKVLNIVLDYYYYTGGAHGLGGKKSLLFETSSGKSISIAKLFKNVAVFKKFAESEFRKKFKIPLNSDINSAEFMFEENQFQLPQNIIFSESGLLLFYNQYECASYAQGAQELFLSVEKLKPYLFKQ